MGKISSHMLEYQKLINCLMGCRPDLSEKVITKKIQDMASQTPSSVSDHLLYCIKRAQEAKPMPWENKKKKGEDEKIRALFEEYKKTIDNDENEEFYMTMREYAEWQVGLFLDWLKKAGTN